LPADVHDVADVQASATTGLAASVAAPVQAVPSQRARTVGLGGVSRPATDRTVQDVADGHETVPGSVGPAPG
jgi:hypothetical protein